MFSNVLDRAGRRRFPPRGMMYGAICAFVALPGGGWCAPTQTWLKDWEVPPGFALQIDVEGFDLPSAIACVPQPGAAPQSPLYFVTELRGKVKVVTRDRTIHTFAEDFFRITPPKELPDGQGQMGMAAIALEPRRGLVFVSFTYHDTNGILRNSLVRFASRPGTFGLKAEATNSFAEIFARDVSGVAHQIGAIVIDGETLFVGVGDGGVAAHARNLDRTQGKILRMTIEGRPLPDNPHYVDEDPTRARNFVWASGLRNPFGMTLVRGRLFVADNGSDNDRFLEVRRGGDYGWDGTDFSTGLNAPMVFGPTVSPVQTTWLPPDNPVFPPEYRGRFYSAFSGGMSPATGVAMLDYDFERERMIRKPEMLLSFVGKRGFAHKRLQLPVGVDFGEGGLYVVPIYPVRPEAGAKSVVLRVSHDPARAHPHVLGRQQGAEAIMARVSCHSCHGQRAGDVNIGPALDIKTLVPRILERLNSDEYRRSLAAVDALEEEPQRSYREARRQVMAARGPEQARLWIKYRVLEPMFDRTTTAMPNLGLTEAEATAIADYFVSRNVGATGQGWIARIKSAASRLISAPLTRKHLAGAFGGGMAVALGAVGAVVAGRRVLRRALR